MSESFVDRILVGPSIEGNGPLTRSLYETHTSGFIRASAPHWSIEPYIPVAPATLIQYLIGREELTVDHEKPFRRCCQELDKILQHRTMSNLSRFVTAYSLVDPDADQKLPAFHGKATQVETADQSQRSSQQESENENRREQSGLDALSVCEQILLDAGFRRLEVDEITSCVGVVSQFGVPLHVDLGIFQTLAVYARGDIIGSRIRRRLRRFYRREVVEVQVYQRMVLIFQLQDDDESEERLAASDVHLRMFKNIPKQDVDTLLPGTRVRISGIDRVKIIVPSLGGFLMAARRVAQTVLLFAAITLHWSAIFVALLIGYLIKSLLSYFQTKNRYQLNLTRNLYFQKLDANAGVGYHTIQLGHQQWLLEAILAQYAILTSDKPLSNRRLRRKCERLIREAVDVEVDFQVERALESLVKAGTVRPTEDDAWIADPAKFL